MCVYIYKMEILPVIIKRNPPVSSQMAIAVGWENHAVDQSCGKNENITFHRFHVFLP